MRQFFGRKRKKKIDPTFVFPQLLFLLFFPSFRLGSGKWSSNSFFLSVEIPTGSFFWGGVWPPPPAIECQKSKLVNLWMRDLCLAKRRTIFLPDFRPNSSMAATNVVFLCSCVWGANFVRSRKKPSDRKKWEEACCVAVWELGKG